MLFLVAERRGNILEDIGVTRGIKLKCNIYGDNGSEQGIVVLFFKVSSPQSYNSLYISRM
jgi:hypothetical protein